MGRLDDRPWDHNHEPLDEISQFPNVARPFIMGKDIHRLGRNLLDFQSLFFRMDMQKMLDQQRDIFSTIT